VAWLYLQPCLVPSWCGTSRTIWYCWKPWGITSLRAADPAIFHREKMGLNNNEHDWINKRIRNFVLSVCVQVFSRFTFWWSCNMLPWRKQTFGILSLTTCSTPDFGGPQILRRAISSILLAFMFVSSFWFNAHFYYAANKSSLWKNEREGLKWMTMRVLFLWRGEWLLLRIMCGTKRLNPFFRLHQQFCHFSLFETKSGLFYNHLVYFFSTWIAVYFRSFFLVFFLTFVKRFCAK